MQLKKNREGDQHIPILTYRQMFIAVPPSTGYSGFSLDVFNIVLKFPKCNPEFSLNQLYQLRIFLPFYKPPLFLLAVGHIAVDDPILLQGALSVRSHAGSWVRSGNGSPPETPGLFFVT